MGRSYWPKVRWARWPTIEPAVIASTIGWNICSIPLNMPAERVVVVGLVGVGRAPAGRGRRPGARRAAGRRRGCPSPSGCGSPAATDTARPPTEVDRPVASATRRSATRASCSIRMRSTGSTLGSLVPSVATLTASWRAPSHAAAALLAEHPGEVAEERHPLERVPEWTVVCHEGIVGRWHPDPTSAAAWSSSPARRRCSGARVAELAAADPDRRPGGRARPASRSRPPRRAWRPTWSTWRRPT